ncbi:MAG TPA: CPBP family glutamic-type intramembrane protease [Caulobacteraceae bacterium]|jgi:hypothetical protein|nr:CPBP family glutamic-type intramembrane protease [Caulobacteraceae bacterium]
MQVWQVLAIGAFAGLASLMLMPVERLTTSRAPPLTLRAATLLQPTLVTALAVWVGCVLGPRVGLRAPVIEAMLRHGDVRSAILAAGPIALASGALLAVVLVLYELRIAPKLPTTSLAARLGPPPLLMRLLYGGVVEELITRWGLISLFVWIAWRLDQQPARVPEAFYWVAILAAAVLFAVGHLPLLLRAAGRPPAQVVAASMAANSVGGLVFGWLFWRRGIEAAMTAHAFAHALAALAAWGRSLLKDAAPG